MAVRSDTVTSASVMTMRTRRRVASPAALSIVVRSENGSCALFINPARVRIRHKDIFMRLNWQGDGGTHPKLDGLSPPTPLPWGGSHEAYVATWISWPRK